MGKTGHSGALVLAGLTALVILTAGCDAAPKQACDPGIGHDCSAVLRIDEGRYSSVALVPERTAQITTVVGEELTDCGDTITCPDGTRTIPATWVEVEAYRIRGFPLDEVVGAPARGGDEGLVAYVRDGLGPKQTKEIGKRLRMLAPAPRG